MATPTPECLRCSKFLIKTNIAGLPDICNSCERICARHPGWAANYRAGMEPMSNIKRGSRCIQGSNGVIWGCGKWYYDRPDLRRHLRRAKAHQCRAIRLTEVNPETEYSDAEYMVIGHSAPSKVKELPDLECTEWHTWVPGLNDTPDLVTVKQEEVECTNTIDWGNMIEGFDQNPAVKVEGPAAAEG